MGMTGRPPQCTLFAEQMRGSGAVLREYGIKAGG